MLLGSVVQGFGQGTAFSIVQCLMPQLGKLEVVKWLEAVIIWGLLHSHSWLGRDDWKLSLGQTHLHVACPCDLDFSQTWQLDFERGRCRRLRKKLHLEAAYSINFHYSLSSESLKPYQIRGHQEMCGYVLKL